MKSQSLNSCRKIFKIRSLNQGTAFQRPAPLSQIPQIRFTTSSPRLNVLNLLTHARQLGTFGFVCNPPPPPCGHYECSETECNKRPRKECEKCEFDCGAENCPAPMKKDAEFFLMVGCLVAVCGGVSHGAYWGYMRFIHCPVETVAEIKAKKGVKGRK
jgi:hypothetical protein